MEAVRPWRGLYKIRCVYARPQQQLQLHVVERNTPYVDTVPLRSQDPGVQVLPTSSM